MLVIDSLTKLLKITPKISKKNFLAAKMTKRRARKVKKNSEPQKTSEHPIPLQCHQVRESCASLDLQVVLSRPSCVKARWILQSLILWHAASVQALSQCHTRSTRMDLYWVLAAFFLAQYSPVLRDTWWPMHQKKLVAHALRKSPLLLLAQRFRNSPVSAWSLPILDLWSLILSFSNLSPPTPLFNWVLTCQTGATTLSKDKSSGPAFSPWLSA